MSASEQQKALAELVRLPECHRHQYLPPFLDQFDLTEAERRQLTALAHDEQVNKYARGMARLRWFDIRKHLPFSLRVANPGAYEYIWRYLFEPAAKRVPHDKLGMAFLDFVSTHPRAVRILEESSPPFIQEVIRVDRARAIVQERSRRGTPPPDSSVLVHCAFHVGKYRYRVSELLPKLAKGEKITHLEEKDEHLLVLMSVESKVRYFVVSEEVYDFLRKEKRGIATKRPPGEGLIRLGLCRA